MFSVMKKMIMFNSECNDTNDDGKGDISERKHNLNPDAVGPWSLPPVLPMLLLH